MNCTPKNIQITCNTFYFLFMGFYYVLRALIDASGGTNVDVGVEDLGAFDLFLHLLIMRKHDSTTEEHTLVECQKNFNLNVVVDLLAVAFFPLSFGRE